MGLWVEIENTSENLVCGVLYKHPSSDLEEFANYLYSCLDKLQQHNKTSLILGDFNINLLNCSAHPPTDAFMNTMSSYFLPRTFSNPHE